MLEKLKAVLIEDQKNKRFQYSLARKGLKERTLWGVPFASTTSSDTRPRVLKFPMSESFSNEQRGRMAQKQKLSFSSEPSKSPSTSSTYFLGRTITSEFVYHLASRPILNNDLLALTIQSRFARHNIPPLQRDQTSQNTLHQSDKHTLFFPQQPATTKRNPPQERTKALRFNKSWLLKNKWCSSMYQTWF